MNKINESLTQADKEFMREIFITTYAVWIPYE